MRSASRPMRIALGQINPTVGDLAGNVALMTRFAAEARDAGCCCVVFPELALPGYPPRDLLLKGDFIDAQHAALADLAAATRGIGVIVGYAERNASAVGRPLHNAVALLEDGRIASRHFKTLLPTYDIFDETRYFEPGPNDLRNNVIHLRHPAGDSVPVGVSICEDLWNDERLIPRRLYHQNPILELHQAGARLLLNISASPFVVDKHDFRRELFAGQVRHVAVPLLYVNQVGGNDELIFDGNSCAFDADGSVIAQAREFEEDLLIVTLDPAETGVDHHPREHHDPDGAALVSPAGFGAAESRVHQVASAVPERASADNRIERHSTGIAAVHRALVLGLRDYVRKCGFEKVVIGLSGGIDSAVVCALAVEALGAEAVTGVGMPGRYSSEHSVSDARRLAENLGIRFELVPIEKVHAAYEQTLSEPLRGGAGDAAGGDAAGGGGTGGGGTCGGGADGGGADGGGADRGGLMGLTDENLQARIRGAILMAFSNDSGAMLLTTGNKSEIAVGYCTLYGDMAGGLAVISDLPKTDVYTLARHMNALAGGDLIPQSTIEKPPSAELRPDQKDTDSLPPYETLDAILLRYVELDQGVEAIVSAGFERAIVERVVRLVDRSEYKRRQMAPGLKVTSRAFGIGRRMPIAQRYDPAESPRLATPAR